MEIIKLEKFIYVQKVSCDFFDEKDSYVSQYYFLVTNKSIYFLREYESGRGQNYSSFKDNLEIFLKINHENMNLYSYSSGDLYSSFLIKIRDSLMKIRVTDIQSSRTKSIKILANILSILDGYKIISQMHNKNLDENFDWLLFVFDIISKENKIIIDDEFFKNIDLDFLSNMIYFLTISFEFEIKLNLFYEENITKLNYILSEGFDDLNDTENHNNYLNLYFRQNSNYLSNQDSQHLDIADYILNNDEKIDYYSINEADLKLGSLNILRFSFNFLNDDYFFFLFKNLNNSLIFLKELEISHNNVTENIFPILIKIFKENKPIKLQKLILNNNRIGGSNLEKNLIDLFYLKTLKLIDLSNNLLDNEFLLNLDNHLNENYNENISSKGIGSQSNSTNIPINNGLNQDIYNTQSSNNLITNNNTNSGNGRPENKIIILLNKNQFEDELRNRHFYKLFFPNLQTRINKSLLENLEFEENKNDSFLFYSVKQFIENTSKFKYKLSFVFDNFLLKDSKNLQLNKEINEILPVNTKQEGSSLKSTNAPTNLNGNILCVSTVKNEIDYEYSFSDDYSNEDKIDNGDNLGMKHELNEIPLNINKEKELDIFKFKFDNHEKTEKLYLVKNYDLEEGVDKINTNIEEDEKIILFPNYQQTNTIDLHQNFNELFFLCDYLFDEKLNNICLDESIKNLNFDEIFFPSLFESIEKKYNQYEKERLNTKSRVINSDNSSNNQSMINLYNYNNENLNKNLIFIKKKYLKKEIVNLLFQKHFNREVNNFHPNAIIDDLKIFFLRFKLLNNNNIFSYLCKKNKRLINIPVHSLHKFLKRVKISTIFALKYNDLYSLNILSEICEYFNMNFKFRVNYQINNLIKRSNIINNSLKGIINLRGHSDTSYKDPFFLHSINNFLDIFIDYAEEINLKNDIVNVAKYLKLKRDFKILEKINKSYKNALREDDLISANTLITSEFDSLNNKYLNIKDHLQFRIPNEISYKFMGFHPVNVDYLKLANAKFEILKKDLVIISKLVNDDQSYGIRNIYDRIHFLLCKSSNETNSKEMKFDLNKKNPFLRIARLIFRFKNSLGVNAKINNQTSFYMDNNTINKYEYNELIDFVDEKTLNSKIKGSQKKPNSLYEISRIKKSSSVKIRKESTENKDQGVNEKLASEKKEKDQNQIKDLSEILKFRQKIMRFNDHKKLEESIIDFSIGFKKEEEVTYLEEISRAHANFLNMCFDENCTIYFFSEEEKKHRASMFKSVIAIHPDKDMNLREEKLQESIGARDSVISRPIITNVNSKKSVFENLEFENVLNISNSAFLIKNFLDHYINLINFKGEVIEKTQKIFQIKRDDLPEEIKAEIEYKIKEYLDEDLCLLIIRQINRENFPKEEIPIKFVLLFLILILPRMSLDFNLINQILYWISYVAEKK